MKARKGHSKSRSSAAQTTQARTKGIAIVCGVGALLIGAVSTLLAEPSAITTTAAPVATTGATAPEASSEGKVSLRTGAFEYSYGFAVPPGREGMQAMLALNYSSEGPMTGSIAAGWGLNVPVIQRDWGLGPNAAVRWTSSLEGRELIAVQEPAPPGAVSYRAQADTSFARYQQFANGSWRVLSTDGRKRYFGEPTYMENGGFDDWAPLTRYVDAYDNEVRYHWKANSEGGTVVGYRLDKIEYTVNDPAGLDAHAEVRLGYNLAEARCAPDVLPIGASLSYRSGERRIDNLYPLKTVTTWVRDPSFREVRRYDLHYGHESDAQWGCDGTEAPMRVLTNVNMIATDKVGSITYTPAMSFEYAGTAVRAAPTEVRFVQGLSQVLPHGERPAAPSVNGDTTTSALLDINGDGLLDHVESAELVVPIDGTQCAIRWRPNEGLSSNGSPMFGSPLTIPLETMDWANGVYDDRRDGSPQGVEHCSLTGQFSMAAKEPASNSYRSYSDAISDHPGTLLMYQFRDWNRDGLVDVATALSGVPEALDGDWHGYETQPCPSLPPANGAPGSAAPDPENPPTPPNTRRPIGGSYCYPWKISTNLEGLSNTHFFRHETLFNAPLPLYAEASDLVSSAGVLTSSARSSVADMDGDGLQDFIRVDTQPGLSTKWFVYRFNGDDLEPPVLWNFAGNGSQGAYPSISWEEPTDGQPNSLKKRFVEESLLIDVNRDGLPDLYRLNKAGTEIDVLYNNGTGFEEPRALAIADGALPDFLSEGFVDGFASGTALVGDRYQLHRILGLGRHNGPGLVAHTGVSGAPYAMFFGLGDGSLIRKSSGLSNMNSRQLLEIGSDSWKIERDLVDLDGDGIQDVVGVGTVASSFWRTEPDGAPRGVMTSFYNGRGLATNISYTPLGDPSVVTFGDGSHPGSRWVVRELSTAYGNSSSAPVTSTWAYASPTRTADDRGLTGFRGFETVVLTSPTGARSEVRFSYDNEWTGEPESSLTFEAGSNNPISISDTSFSSEKLSVDKDVYARALESSSFTCERMGSGGLKETLSEGTCRAQVTPLVSFAERVHDIFGFYNRFEYEAELTGPGVANGFITQNDIAWRYTSDDYRVVTTRVQNFVGSAVENGGSWSPSRETRSGATEFRFDFALRSLERTCSARDATEMFATGAVNDQLAACSAVSINSLGQVVKTQKPNQYFEEVVQGGALPLTSRYSEVIYDSASNVFPVTVINELGHTVTSTIDPATGVEIESFGPNAQEASRRTVDALGRILTEEVAVTPNNFLQTLVVEYTDGAQQSSVAKIARYSVTGAPTWENLYNNTYFTEIHSTFDGLGRPASVTEQDLNNQNAESVIRYQYNTMGKMVRETSPDPSQDSLSATVDTLHEYDSLGRKICTVRSDGSGVATVLAGRTTKAIEFVPDGAGGGTCANTVSEPIEPVSTSWIVTDIFGRTVLSEEALDSAVPNDRATTKYEYGQDGLLERVVRLAGTIDDPDTDTLTLFEHNWRGERTKTIRHGREWSFLFDRNGNLESTTPPHTGSAATYISSSAYDDLDRPTSKLHPAADLSGDTGNDEQTEFDVGMWFYEYDQGPYGVGQLTSIESPGAMRRTDIHYNNEGRLRTQTTTINLAALGLPLVHSFTKETFGYTTDGKPTRELHETGVGTYRLYKRAGNQPWSVGVLKDGTTNQFEDRFVYKRNVAGYVTRLDHLLNEPSLQVGRQVSFTHDSLGRVISTSSNDEASEQVTQSMVYSGSGEVLSLSSVVGDLVDPRSYNYDYDHRHQLLEASDDQGFVASYTYTRTGLLASARVEAPVTPGAVVHPRDVTYSYPSEGASINGITDPETVTALANVGADPGDPGFSEYTYDAAGNMTSRTVNTNAGSEVVQMRYDGMQRLRRRTAASGESETYQYFGPQRWLATEDTNTSGTTRKVRIWLGASEIIYNCTASACTEEGKRTTIAFGGQSVARIDQDAQGTRDPKLLHASGLGHLLAVYTYDRPQSGGIDYTLASAFQYGPFGEILESASAPNVSTDDFLQRFNGKEYDTKSGLSYYGYRYYEPIAQIWNRPDPMYRNSPESPGADRRANLYTFSLNNPVRYVDPDGLDARADAQQALDTAYEDAVFFAHLHCGQDDACLMEIQAELHAAYEKASAVIEQLFAHDEGESEPSPGRAGRAAEWIWGKIEHVPILVLARASAKVVLFEPSAAVNVFSDAIDAYGDVLDRGGPSKKMGKPDSDCPCFTAGTLVMTETGHVPIEEIKAGAKVACSEPESGQWTWCEVEYPLTKLYEGDLIVIEVGGDTIEATIEHPFWVVNGSQLWDRPSAERETGEVEDGISQAGRWIRAEHLEIGDLVRLTNGGVAPVVSKESVATATTVYNLSVAQLHNYAVGEAGVLVHNSCCSGPNLKTNPHAKIVDDRRTRRNARRSRRGREKAKQAAAVRKKNRGPSGETPRQRRKRGGVKKKKRGAHEGPGNDPRADSTTMGHH